MSESSRPKVEEGFDAKPMNSEGKERGKEKRTGGGSAGGSPQSSLAYHPSSVETIKREGGGYVGFLNGVQQKAFETLSARLLSPDPPLGVGKAAWQSDWQSELSTVSGREGYSHFLCRWLRAREFDAEKAFEMVCEHIGWRLRESVSRLMTLSEEEVLGGCPKADALAMCPHWVGGFDSQQRPFVFHQYEKLDCSSLLSLTTLDCLVRHHIWEQEKLSDLVAHKVCTPCNCCACGAYFLLLHLVSWIFFVCRSHLCFHFGVP